MLKKVGRSDAKTHDEHNMRFSDWVMVLLIITFVCAASTCGLLQKWACMTGCIGMVFILMGIYTMIFFHSFRIIAAYAISGTGVMAIVMAGLILISGNAAEVAVFLIPLIFAGLGFVFIFYSVNVKKKQQRCKMEIIAAVQCDKNVTVEYCYNGKNYNCVCKELSADSDFSSGDGIKIYINPLNPAEYCVSHKDYGVFTIVGVLFVMMAAIVFSAAIIILYSTGRFIDRFY